MPILRDVLESIFKYRTSTPEKDLSFALTPTTANAADFGATGDGTTDDRAALQSTINFIVAAGGGTVYIPAGRYLITRVAGGDSQFNGLTIPYTNVFGYTSHISVRGDGRATVLLAGDNSMVVIRLSDSNDNLRDFAIDGNSKTGVTGLALIGSNTASGALAENIDHNKITIDIRNCAEGVELESPSAGGCYYNTFSGGIWQDNTRHIRMRDNAIAKGANRNRFKGITLIGGNCGLYNDGADTTMLESCTFEAISSGATPLATPTAVYWNATGSVGGQNTENTNLIDCNFESNIRDLDCNNRRASIVGGTCGNQAGGGVFGAVVGSATPDNWDGGDRIFQKRELLIGGPAVDSVLLDNRFAAYSAAQALIGTSANVAGAFPFENDGTILVQGRQQVTSGVQIATGAASAGGINCLGNGEVVIRSGSHSIVVIGATYSASITLDASLGNVFEIVATNGVAFTINAPTNPRKGMKMTIVIFNVSGGALGAVTFNATFKLSAWTQPANGNNRAITFYYGGTAWREFSRTPADVPN